VAILHGDDRQRLIPLALIQVLTCLIDETDDYRKAPLRAVRAQLCRLYRIADPDRRANDVEVAQMMEEEDGVPQDDAP